MRPGQICSCMWANPRSAAMGPGCRSRSRWLQRQTAPLSSISTCQPRNVVALTLTKPELTRSFSFDSAASAVASDGSTPQPFGIGAAITAGDDGKHAYIGAAVPPSGVL